MKKRKRMLNLFYIPALILILFFVVYPLLEAFRISFTQWNGYSQDYKYIGFSNYAKLFKDENFRTAFINTIIYGFGSTLLQNVFGLAYAVFLNSRFRGHSVVRTFIYLPAMISGLIMGYIIYFFVMYNHGVFNEIIGWFGAAPVDWMADGPRGVIIMTLINSWHLYGYLSGRTSECATDVSGSCGNRWGKFLAAFPSYYISVTSSIDRFSSCLKFDRWPEIV